MLLFISYICTKITPRDNNHINNPYHHHLSMPNYLVYAEGLTVIIMVVLITGLLNNKLELSILNT